MKKILLICVLVFSIAVQPAYAQTNGVKRSELFNKLNAIEGISSIRLLANQVGHERYLLTFTQPLDENNPQAGTFEQRIMLSHADYNAPVLFATEGYSITFSPSFSYELQKKFNTNIISVEYRYYGESVPSTRDWEYLKLRLQANDLHHIREAFRALYPGKWFAYGSSKGGTNCMVYLSYYPDDLDFYITNSSPLSLAIEDSKYTNYLSKIGTAQERRKVVEFQKELLRRKAEILPYFERLAKKKNYNFAMSVSDAYEFVVLDLAFCYWQRHQFLKSYPLEKATTPQAMCNILEVFSNIEEYTMRLLRPYFMQTVMESGYYGFDTSALKGLLHIDPSQRIRKYLVPEELRDYQTDHSTLEYVIKTLEAGDPKLICLYFEYDPYTAASLPDKCFAGKTNMHKYISPQGGHCLNFSLLPTELQDQIFGQIEAWLQD